MGIFGAAGRTEAGIPLSGRDGGGTESGAPLGMDDARTVGEDDRGDAKTSMSRLGGAEQGEMDSGLAQKGVTDVTSCRRVAFGGARAAQAGGSRRNAGNGTGRSR